MTARSKVRSDGSPTLGWGTLAALAGPSISLSALSLPLVVYLPPFYSGGLGLKLALVGAVFMAVRLADIGFDPLLGGIMDRTRTPIGRYRPWLLAGAPMVMLGMAMLFMAKPGVGPIYLAGWLVLAYLGWSTLSLSQLALAANVSPDYHERSRIYGWWQAASMVGLIVSMLMPKLMAESGHGDAASGMKAMAWLVVVITPVLVLVTTFGVKERPVGLERHASGFKEYFGLLRRGIVVRLLLAELLLGVSGGATSTLTLFFFTRAKGMLASDVGLILIANFVVALGTTPLWSALANRIGKHRALMVSALIYCCFQLAFIVAPKGNLALMCLCAAGAGVSFGATALLPRAMMADISDVERLETGADRTGLLFALLIGVWKIGQAVSVGGMFAALAVIGFNPKAGAGVSHSALTGLYGLYVGLPVLLSLAAALTIRGYSLTAERHGEVRVKLEARDRAARDFAAASIESESEAEGALAPLPR